MKELIYHKFRNSSIGGYLVRNGEDMGNPIGINATTVEVGGYTKTP